jgi:hypothetical protein
VWRVVDRLHLADWNGVPMHAVENGRYWLGLCDGQGYARETFMRLWRVTAEEADSIREYVTVPAGEHSDREALNFMVKIMHMPERWKAEAEAALAVILS